MPAEALGKDLGRQNRVQKGRVQKDRVRQRALRPALRWDEGWRSDADWPWLRFPGLDPGQGLALARRAWFRQAF